MATVLYKVAKKIRSLEMRMRMMVAGAVIMLVVALFFSFQVCGYSFDIEDPDVEAQWSFNEIVEIINVKAVTMGGATINRVEGKADKAQITADGAQKAVEKSEEKIGKLISAEELDLAVQILRAQGVKPIALKDMTPDVKKTVQAAIDKAKNLLRIADPLEQAMARLEATTPAPVPDLLGPRVTAIEVTLNGRPADPKIQGDKGVVGLVARVNTMEGQWTAMEAAWPLTKGGTKDTLAGTTAVGVFVGEKVKELGDSVDKKINVITAVLPKDEEGKLIPVASQKKVEGLEVGLNKKLDATEFDGFKKDVEKATIVSTLQRFDLNEDSIELVKEYQISEESGKLQEFKEKLKTLGKSKMFSRLQKAARALEEQGVF